MTARGRDEGGPNARRAPTKSTGTVLTGGPGRGLRRSRGVHMANETVGGSLASSLTGSQALPAAPSKGLGYGRAEILAALFDGETLRAATVSPERPPERSRSWVARTTCIIRS